MPDKSNLTKPTDLWLIPSTLGISSLHQTHCRYIWIIQNKLHVGYDENRKGIKLYFRGLARITQLIF